MKSTKKWTNALWILNVIYLIVLTWLILLKGSVSLPAFGQFRSINLIPFGASCLYPTWAVHWPTSSPLASGGLVFDWLRGELTV